MHSERHDGDYNRVRLAAQRVLIKPVTNRDQACKVFVVECVPWSAARRERASAGQVDAQDDAPDCTPLSGPRAEPPPTAQEPEGGRCGRGTAVTGCTATRCSVASWWVSVWRLMLAAPRIGVLA